MPKRSEKRDTAKAEYIAKKKKGEEVSLRALAVELGVSYQTLRNWKAADKWEEALPKKKRGGQPGNQNSKGKHNAAGSHDGAPPGNKNAEKDGAYSTVFFDMLSAEELKITESVPLGGREALEHEMKILKFREHKILEKIAAYESQPEDALFVSSLLDIVTGQIPIVGEGVNEIIDFGFTNTETLTGTAQWGKSAAKINDNLEDWADKVLTNGFANVDMAIMGKTALRNFLADEKIGKMLDNRRVEMGLIHPRDLPNGVKYVGHLNSPNIDIYTYAEVYLDDWTNPEAPETKPLVPENKVVLIASHPDYMMSYGACTYIEDSTQQWVTAQTNRLLRSYVAHQPDRRMLELQAHPLPIPDKVDSWFVATVC